MKHKKKRDWYFRGIKKHAQKWQVTENHLRYVLKGERFNPAMEEDYYRCNPNVPRYDKAAHLKRMEKERRAQLCQN